MAIYVIQAGGAEGPVKFGRAENVNARLAALSTASPYPLNLVAELDAPDEAERQFHWLLRDHRLNGEWFIWCPEVAAAVDMAKSGEWPKDIDNPARIDRTPHRKRGQCKPDFGAIDGLNAEDKIGVILAWWPSLEEASASILRWAPAGSALKPASLYPWHYRGMSARWVIPLLRAAENDFGAIPIALSKVPAVDRAAIIQELQQKYGLSVDWPLIESLLSGHR